LIEELEENVAWKSVVGYEGIYEVSSSGQIRTSADNPRKQRTLTRKVHSKNNTCHISLFKDKERKQWLIHRLVAFAFMPLIEGKDFINHIDGDRLNNDVSNLEWCTYAENINHAFDTGLQSTNVRVSLRDKATGETHSFRSMTKACEFLGRHRSTISNFLAKGQTEISGYDIVREEVGHNRPRVADSRSCV
jgi:hypothetical protein